MNHSVSRILCALLLTTTASFADVDIIPTKKGGSPVWVLKDTDSKKVIGTFWDSVKQTSDFNYEGSGSEELKLVWSADRKYVAVKGGDARSQQTFLYLIADNKLTKVTIPELSGKAAVSFKKLKDIQAEGSLPVRWQADGTLLLNFWAQDRQVSDVEPKKVDVWITLQVTGTDAKIVGSTTKEPKAGR